MVLCFDCGSEIARPDISVQCLLCLRRDVDITAGVSRQVHVQQCGTCSRWRKPGGSQWVQAQPESRELLAVCVKSVKGLSKSRQVVDSSFIWTEPHSKELLLKVSLQQEVASGVVMQQTMVVNIRVDSLQCPGCQKLFTPHKWESCVQVRQRVEHRRTLLHLEQMILQHGAHKTLVDLQETREGIDFFFSRDRDAVAFAAFVKGWAVARQVISKRLVSHNANSNCYRFKRTLRLEICPICRDDLVHVPLRASQALGGVPPLMLCSRAASTLALVDPFSGRAVEVSAVEYWKNPVFPACSARHLTEFIVLDVPRPLWTAGPSAPSGDVEVARRADFGRNEDRLLLSSHLSQHLQPGDSVLGFDLRTLATGLEEAELQRVPLDAYLVRKMRLRAEKKKSSGTSRRRKVRCEGRLSKRGAPGDGAGSKADSAEAMAERSVSVSVEEGADAVASGGGAETGGRRLRLAGQRSRALAEEQEEHREQDEEQEEQDEEQEEQDEEQEGLGEEEEEEEEEEQVRALKLAAERLLSTMGPQAADGEAAAAVVPEPPG